MKLIITFWTLLLFSAANVKGIHSSTSFLKDSTKTQKKNYKKMQELQKMLVLVKKGAPAPGFCLVSNKKDSVRLSDFIGKTVVIDFWATWCPPCIAQVPQYEKLKIKYKDKDVVFISVSIDYSKSKWEKFLERRPQFTGIQLWSGPHKPAYYYTLMDYNTMLRADTISANSSEMKKSLENGTNIFDGVPGNFVIIDREGKIVADWLLPSNSPEMENILNKLLN